jgi:cytidine deaminase
MRESLTSAYMVPPPSALLAQLTNLAQAAAQNAYAPYSNFFVGAAILLESGEMVSGCNVENASYRLTTCAEQNAIASAVARHGPHIRLRALAVRNRNATVCQPCGACRQTIAEFAPPDAWILFPGSQGEDASCTLADLLPSAFSLLHAPQRT